MIKMTTKNTIISYNTLLSQKVNTEGTTADRKIIFLLLFLLINIFFSLLMSRILHYTVHFLQYV